MHRTNPRRWTAAAFVAGVAFVAISPVAGSARSGIDEPPSSLAKAVFSEGERVTGLWSIGVVALATGASEAATQQILEVDMDAGREIAGGLEYLFGFEAVVDYGRRQVLVTEVTDPLAVTAYSLDDGSVQGVFGGGPAGDGPGELAYMEAVALGPDGVFMAGGRRVLYWSWSGALVYQWTPTAPRTNALCAFNGRPAVPLQQGMVFRDDDGESVALDGETGLEFDFSAGSVTDVTRASSSTFLACADSVAYKLDGYNHVLTEHKLGAEPRVVAIPAEVMEAARKRMEASSGSGFDYGYRNLFLTDDGRLVVETHTWDVSGAVVDRATGCYALLKNDTRPGSRRYAGMFGDSVVTFEASREPMTTTMLRGKRYPVFSTDKSYIFVRPVRPTSGEPCS